MTRQTFAGLSEPMLAEDLCVRALREQDGPAIARASLSDDDMYAWMLARRPQSEAEVLNDIGVTLEGVERRAWVALVMERPDGTLAGVTRFFDDRGLDRGIEIGHTAIFAGARGTWINGRAKLLMLERVFSLDYARVQLKTDARNARSRAAIAGIGATFEGVLRSYQRRGDGTLRDTAMFSILAPEWPDVRRTLEARIAQRKGVLAR